MEQFEDCKVTSPTKTKGSELVSAKRLRIFKTKQWKYSIFTDSKKKSTQLRLHPHNWTHSIWAPDASFQDAKTAIRIGQYLDLLSPAAFSGQQVRKHKEIIWEKCRKTSLPKSKQISSRICFKMAPDFTWVSCKQYKIWNLIWSRKVRSPAQHSGTTRQFTGLLNWQYDCRLIHPSHHYWSSTRCPQKFP